MASSGQFVIEFDAKSRENKVVDEHSKIQCFQTPHTPTFGAMTFMNLGGVRGLKIVANFGVDKAPEPKIENCKFVSRTWRQSVMASSGL